jgi:hypothetical protein
MSRCVFCERTNRMTTTLAATPSNGGLAMTLKMLGTATMIATAACMASACIERASTTDGETTIVSSSTECRPVKIALIADKSKSAPGTRTPTLTLDDVESLIQVLASCGGELAVGVIHDRITDPFVRLRLDAQPKRPADSQARNVLRQRREQAAIERAHTEALQLWEDEADSRVEAFSERVVPLVDHPVDADWSPVWDGVVRGDLFLAEREHVPVSDARRVLILVSDAIDDVRGAPAQRRPPLRTLRSDAALLIVNGAGSGGSLTALAPELFESFDAARRYVERLAATPRQTAVANN